MIERKLAGKSAKSILLEEFNDLDVYIEDTAIGFKKIFTELLNKAFKSKYKIEHVFPLGTRDNVISKCRENQNSDGRKKVYIVDGDLYLMRGEKEEDLQGLFVLPRYCIENFLLDENALIDILYEEDPELTKEDITSKLNFRNWIELNNESLVNLFTDYAIAHKLMPEVETVGYKVSNLTTSGNGIVCHHKVAARIQELSSMVKEKVGESVYNEEHSRIVDEINNEENKIFKYVSGKDYLIPLLQSRCKTFAKLSSSNTNIKLRLAIKSNVQDLENVVECILE